jgi:Putative Flp pilus-assembly TadE/G-like
MPQRQSDERGTVAIVVALSLTMLLAFAALVVDVGLNWAARTQAQTAADSAALAGASRLPADPAGALTAVRDALNANVTGLVGASMAWASDGDEANGEVRCWTPPAAPPTGAAPCVGTGMTAIQVITPPLLERYAFAGVLGRDSAEVKAAARAGVFSAGNVLPWGMLVDDPIPSPGRICLQTDGSVDGVGGCPTGASNAGYLRPLEGARLHEVPCVDGPSAYPVNVRSGIDHEQLPYTGSGAVNDDCGASGAPNTMTVMDLGSETASSTSTGLLGALPGPVGRLRANPPELGATVLGGLWDGDFLDPASVAPLPAGLPVTPGYSGDGFFAGGADFATYQGCLGTLDAPGCQEIFDQRIASSARFVYLPVVQRANGSSTWPNGSNQRVRILGFRAAFIEMPMDGTGLPALGPTGVEIVSLYLLPASMLPDQITGPQLGSLFYSGGVKTVHLTG